MATKEDFVKEVTKLPGVGKTTAEKLWDAGYKTLADLKGVTEDKLKEAGITGRAVEAVLEGLKDLESPAGAAAPAIEVREAKDRARGAREAAKVEVVERPYQAKIKAELPEDVQKALRARREKAKHEPAFRRYHWWYGTGRLSDSWRSLKGIHNKQKVGLKYRPPVVSIGYGKPALSRGLHPSGFQEVMVHNVNELGRVADPKTQAARIGRTVGGKKHEAIEKAAAERGIRVLNPRRSAQ